MEADLLLSWSHSPDQKEVPACPGSRLQRQQQNHPHSLKSQTLGPKSEEEAGRKLWALEPENLSSTLRDLGLGLNGNPWPWRAPILAALDRPPGVSLVSKPQTPSHNPKFTKCLLMWKEKWFITYKAGGSWAGELYAALVNPPSPL